MKGMSAKERDTSLLGRFIDWREKHISERQFILLLSLAVGIFTALAALICTLVVTEYQ